MQIRPRSFIRSDQGKVRTSNQDSGYSGYQLFFVADGMGGHAGGDIASALVTQNVALVDQAFEGVEEAKLALTEALVQANDKLSVTVRDHPELHGLGTTFSGLAVVGTKLVMAHIGDSRVYRVSGGRVDQVSKDHTFVQRLVDLGRITEEEALVHPRRSVLMRVLGDVEENPEIDNEVFDAVAGDRWLICSDGLSGVVPEGVMNDILLSNASAQEVTDLLIGETLEHGAYDNVTVIVLDIQTATTIGDYQASAQFVGSATNPVVFVDNKGKNMLRFLNPKHLQQLILHEPQDSAFERESDEYLDYILSLTKKRIRRRRIRQAVLWLTIFAVLGSALALGYNYTQTRYYVGEYQGKIAIYQGIREALGPLKFSKLYSETSYSLDSLTEFNRELVLQTVPATDYLDALRILDTLVGKE